MLGERGLWYKRSFFEGSSRIPLMVSWPGQFEPTRVAANVSLVDLLPTFVALAGDQVEPVDQLAGASLLPLCADPATASSDIVYGENLSEGATAPILMVKRGSMKYVWSGCDPEQLFDLSNDPHELTNLADDPAQAEAKGELNAMAMARWNVDELANLVLESQRRRKFLRSLYADSLAPEWRTPPPDQAAQRVLAEGVPYNDWAYDNVLA